MSDKQGEQMEQLVKERAAREMQRLPHIQSWPHDADGVPMAIVTGAASDLLPTVQYGNVVIGPVTIMRPVPNGTDEEIIESARAVQKMAEYVIGTQRRLLQWALDPSTRVEHPTTGETFTGAGETPVAPAPEPQQQSQQQPNPAGGVSVG